MEIFSLKKKRYVNSSFASVAFLDFTEKSDFLHAKTFFEETSFYNDFSHLVPKEIDDHKRFAHADQVGRYSDPNIKKNVPIEKFRF